MSIFSRIAGLLTGGAGAVGAAAANLRAALAALSDSDLRRQAAFAIAMIALSAKMAKADGVVTADEVKAFKHAFRVSDAEMKQGARVFNLAKQNVAGYEACAEQLVIVF